MRPELPMAARRNRLAFWAALAAIAGVAAWARLARRHEVFVGDHVIPIEEDCYFHLRRILQAVSDFPHVPVRDPHIDWPSGATIPWPPGFDQLGALWVFLTGASGSPLAAARSAAVLPVVLGVCAVAGTALLARALLAKDPNAKDPNRDAAALAAGWFMALLPQGVAASMIGRIDHHVAEACMVILFAGWALRACDARPAQSLRRDLLFEAQGALLTAAAVHVFAGAVLYAGVTAGVLVFAALAAPTRAKNPLRAFAGSGGPAFLIGAGASALLIAPRVSEHGHVFHHLYASFMQPLLLAVAGAAIAIAIGAAAAVPSTERGRAVFLRRLAVAAAAVLAVLAAGALLVPGARREIGSGLREWLAKDDEFMAAISETQPLFLSGGPLSIEGWRAVHNYFGVVGLAAPVCAPAGTWLLLRADPKRGACFAAFAGWLAFLTLVQMRFGRILVVFMAIWTGVAVTRAAEHAASALAARLRRTPPPYGTASLVLIALAALVDPSPRRFLLPRETPPLAALPEAALFLRGEPPVQPGRRSGVFAPWDMGFVLLHLADRPVILSGFGHYISPVAWGEVEHAFRSDEKELLGLMERRDLGYVVAGAASFRLVPSPEGRMPFLQPEQGPGVLDAAYFATMPLSPLIVGGSGDPSLGVRHLGRLMPRFASTQLVSGLAAPVPRLWVYERVLGARLIGPGDDGDLVVASVELSVGGVYSVDYVAWSRAKGDRFAMRIPVPSAWTSAGLRTGPAYRVSVGGRPPVELVVPEAAVRGGAELPLP